ncbi:mini-circle protein [Serinicoccus sp. CNJ-927]|uniref:DinB family protein n=1 Tax=Serinicoccus sp. CNJ-927 TaxID=1904970 RepID=UPI000959A273|nr:DinB family protein [Serinicoccus sp. CNJ-927]OLT45024.1 mini-circle protein [Serinicoccus sp. CNJ-927]
MSDITIDEVGRPEPPLAAGEAATLVGFLDYQRATLEWKTRDLEADGLRVRLSGHASTMTLAGLLKHLAWVEDYWFTEVLSEATMPAPWDTVDWEADEDWEWSSAATDDPAAVRETWATSVQRSRAALTEALVADGEDPLGVTHPAWGGRGHVSVRWTLTHMVEEYARHNGHADLLRELADGQTGE